MVDVHRLRVLRAVVADGSINGAAASLGYTSSAISQHLAALQREVGLTLVQRSGRGIEATEMGRALAAESDTVFDSLARLDALIGDLRAGRTGTLALSYFASAGVAWIPAVVAAVTREFPRLRLDLRLIELLGETTGDPDVEVYVEGSPSSTMSGYRTYPLSQEPYLAVVPADCALAARTEIPLRELRDEAWVDNDLARGPCRQLILDACCTVGFTPAFRVQAQDYLSAIRFVAEGIGITVVPRLGIGDLPPSVVAVPIVDPTPVRRIAVRVRDAVAHSPVVDRIVGLLEDCAQLTMSAA